VGRDDDRHALLQRCVEGCHCCLAKILVLVLVLLPLSSLSLGQKGQRRAKRQSLVGLIKITGLMAGLGLGLGL
jgi:hypothetical protein